MKDTSREFFDTFYSSGEKMIRVQLRNGTVYEGRFIGYFLGDAEEGEPYIFRWHFLERMNVFDYDKSIDPEQGIYIEQNEIQNITFI